MLLISFITSRYDYGGYLCMGTNNSLSLQERRQLSLSSLSLAGQTLESLACETTPPRFPSFLVLALFLPILRLHSPSARGTTNRNRVSSSTVTATSLPDAKLSKLHIPKPRCGSWAQAYVLLNSICTKSTTTEGAPVAEGLP